MIELSPDSAELHFSRGIVFAAMGNWEGAEADFGIAKETGLTLDTLFHAEYESTSALRGNIM